MYITRDLEPIIKQVAKEYPVLLLTGPRQVGKTTLLRHLSSSDGTKRTYVSLDSLEARTLANRDPDAFFSKYPPPILIDEVQYAPDLFRAIKVLVDERRCSGEFWLTGSQVFHLMQNVQESLAGRVVHLSLGTLSQNERFSHLEPRAFSLDLEYLQSKQSILGPTSAYDIFSRITASAMPSIASGKVTNQALFYESYLNTYIQRDVRDVVEIKDASEFRRFFTTVAARTGQVLNIADMARDLDIHPATAKSWLGILETLGLIYSLPPYFNNLLKRAIKTPKIYMSDVALVCHLLKIDSADSLLSSPIKGSVFETYVINEIVRSYRNVGREPWMYYYRDIDQREIDIIFEQDGTINPIEIKTTEAPPPQLVRTFRVLDSGVYPRDRGAILCNTPTIEQLDAGNWGIPVALI